MSNLIKPHGGRLCDLMVDKDSKEHLLKDSINFKSYNLTDRQLCDLELLLNGSFSPLTGFLCRTDYDSVLETNRLSDGTVWPIPITLDVSQKIANNLNIGEKIVLRDFEGIAISLLRIQDKWTPDLLNEANLIYGTTDTLHPAVDYLFNKSGKVYIAGKLEGLEYPKHYDYQLDRHAPLDLRNYFEKMGWQKIIAFQTRNPMHRAHKEIVTRASNEIGGNVLIHPVVGMTKPGDVDHYTRVRCYKKVMDKFPKGLAKLSLLQLAMRMGGPREALWHALIRKNYGCSHFIVGRDHAGPGLDSNSKSFYGPYEAQEMLTTYSDEIGVEMVPFKMMVYVKEKSKYMFINDVPKGMEQLNISGTELRSRLNKDIDIPKWFTYPEIVKELKEAHPPKAKKGFTVFFTGLSGSGKSTIANALLVKLLENGHRRVTLLDGDIVRINLSSELGFSKEHRDLNIQRIGFVASEITKNGGIAICAPIAPYNNIRDINRKLISSVGNYIEVYVSTPLKICEKRDIKGLYAKARKGIIKGFTGIDDPYEIPKAPELTIDTTDISQEKAVSIVIEYLRKDCFIK